MADNDVFVVGHCRRQLGKQSCRPPAPTLLVQVGQVSTRPATAAALARGTLTASDLSNGQSAAGKACRARPVPTTASTTAARWSGGHGVDARRPGRARVTNHATRSSSPFSTTSGTGAPCAASQSILAASPLSSVPARPWAIETLA
jgi:hypothetical protein